MIEEFTQLLVNSGHKFTFIKSIILQAVTKYEYMLGRNRLDQSDARYQPLYRARTYDDMNRKILKYINISLLYTREDLGDPFRQKWKRFVKRKSDRRQLNKRKRIAERNKKVEEKDNRRITTTMFVPSSQNGVLLALLEQVEEELKGELDWTVKLEEKSGKALKTMFLPSFTIVDGCVLGENCQVCANNGIHCRPESVVYIATCQKCNTDR